MIDAAVNNAHVLYHSRGTARKLTPTHFRMALMEALIGTFTQREARQAGEGALQAGRTAPCAGEVAAGAVMYGVCAGVTKQAWRAPAENKGGLPDVWACVSLRLLEETPAGGVGGG